MHGLTGMNMATHNFSSLSVPNTAQKKHTTKTATLLTYTSFHSNRLIPPNVFVMASPSKPASSPFHLPN